MKRDACNASLHAAAKRGIQGRDAGKTGKRAFKQWGEIANNMGTLAEDIVAPGVREVARKCFGFTNESSFKKNY